MKVFKKGITWRNSDFGGFEPFTTDLWLAFLIVPILLIFRLDADIKQVLIIIARKDISFMCTPVCIC